MEKSDAYLIQSSTAPPHAPTSRAKLVGFCLFVSAAFLVLVGLGIWQIERLSWKTDLIAKVTERVAAPPASVPGPAEWPLITSQNSAYRHVSVTGVYDNDQDVLIHALTEHGSGYWVMTPLRADLGFFILVNRGFIPDDKALLAKRSQRTVVGETKVTGLLRVTEPKGQLLRANDPVRHLWYSRDVAAIAASLQLNNVAPYFIDADATPNAGGWPLGGLTVISFPNNHLVYAITWFSLALMLIAFAILTLRKPERVRHVPDQH